MKSNNYCVYCHIVPNDKRYYGMSQNVKRRWRSDGYDYKNNIDFYNDILFYGWNNIEHIIVAKGLSKEDAEWLEEELIKTNRTYDSEYGYNKYIGNKWTDEQKAKQSEANSGINSPMYGKIFSEEHKAKLSESLRGRALSEEHKAKISESHKGKCHSEETKAKISGANNYNAKRVICITTMTVFDTIREGANYYGIDESGISQCCNEKRKSAGKLSDGTKLVWRYLYTKIL